MGAMLALLLATGCATSSRDLPPPPRPFTFERDTFAFANELRWEYLFDDATGKVTTRRSNPPATYGFRCFVLAKAVRQFHQHARFDPRLPPASDATYRRLIARVLFRSPTAESPPADRIIIPGFADLRAFSAARESLLKAACGGAWQSYVQPGHWRMIFPFRRRQQEQTAHKLVAALRGGRTAVVHLVRFPSLAINHAVVLFHAEPTAAGIRFHVYDPNNPKQPLVMDYLRAQRTFFFPRTRYFAGGRVDVNEIYRHRPPAPPPLRSPRDATRRR